MQDDIVVLGYGPVGRATVERLRAQGRPVRVAQRSLPMDLPDGVAFSPCDVLDPASLRTARSLVPLVAILVAMLASGSGLPARSTASCAPTGTTMPATSTSCPITWCTRPSGNGPSAPRARVTYEERSTCPACSAWLDAIALTPRRR